MRSAPSCLAALGVLVQIIPEASAHCFVNLIKTGGKFYPGWDLNYYYQSNPPAVAGWSTTALDSGFVRTPKPIDPSILPSAPIPNLSNQLTQTLPGLPRQLPIRRHNLPQIRRARQSPHPRRRRPNRAALLEHLAPRPQRPRPRLPRPLHRQQLHHDLQNRPQIRQNRPARPQSRARARHLGDG